MFQALGFTFREIKRKGKACKFPFARLTSFKYVQLSIILHRNVVASVVILALYDARLPSPPVKRGAYSS